MDLDASFLGRVLYYNESKVLRMLAKAQSPDDFLRARKALYKYSESLRNLANF